MIVKETQLIMGMPIHISIVVQPEKERQAHSAIAQAYRWFAEVDARFSPYKESSELCLLRRGEVAAEDISASMAEVLSLCLTFEALTNGYFRLVRKDVLDPTGLVKGWSIQKASDILVDLGFSNHLIDAGGDMIAHGDKDGKGWEVGIKYPANPTLLAKVISLKDQAIATSGTYERGLHIEAIDDTAADEITSLTVIGADITLIDCLATAAFAMGLEGITFIEQWPEVEGYMIIDDNEAIATSGFTDYEVTSVAA